MRRFLFRPALPKGPPPGSVTPTILSEAGLVVCPRCGGLCRSPTGWNPWTGRDERMILVGNRTARCPHCHAQHYITPTLARRYNHRLYPDDPAYAPDEDD